MRTNGAPADPQPDARARILEAALTSFASDGYDGATTREIARRARVPLGLLRYYFGDKLKLWQASVDRAVAEIRSGLDTPLDVAQGDGDDLSGIRAAIRTHVHYVARNPEFVRLMHDEGRRRGPRMRWLVDRHVKPIFARLIPMVRHLQERGRLPADIDPLHFVYCLIGAIDVIFHQAEECRRVTGVDPKDPAVVEAHVRAVEFMLLGAPPAAATPRRAPGR
ncbi:MAG: TetR/AcrR family transcriptional regulator [Myxococcota bacterium]